jgi:hypothetical protein
VNRVTLYRNGKLFLVLYYCHDHESYVVENHVKGETHVILNQRKKKKYFIENLKTLIVKDSSK